MRTKLAFLAIAMAVGLLPVFIRFDYMPGWLIEQRPREYRRVYSLSDFYVSVTHNPDSRCPPYYQPLLVNTALLILYSSIVYSSGAAMIRHLRHRHSGSAHHVESNHPSAPPAPS
jgi:hypothetical protein